MKSPSTNNHAHKILQSLSLLLLIAALLLLCASPAAAQKDKKKKKDAPTADADTASVVSSLSDEQQIDYMISEVLGAWKIGDIDKLRKDYADEVIVVSGAFVDKVWNYGPVTTYGPNDMVLDNWGTVDHWIADEKVTSYGPSGIGFVNFGTVGLL